MKIGKTHVEVSGEKIAKLDVNGIVNPANNMLWMGGGISSEIRKAGGKSIEEEALNKAPAETGDAVVTGAGDLKARWIIHAVISGQDLTVNEATLLKWLKKTGDFVKKEEPLLEVENDKATYEVESPANGRISKIIVKEQETVQFGAVLGTILPTEI